MATAEYYCKTWIFFEATGSNKVHEAYPLGSTVTIGRQGKEKFMLAWTDLHDVLHVLTDLTWKDDGCLAGPELGTKDLATGDPWLIEITAKEDSDQIAGTVSSLEIEGNLTGAWGAEAPPHP